MVDTWANGHSGMTYLARRLLAVNAHLLGHLPGITFEQLPPGNPGHQELTQR